MSKPYLPRCRTCDINPDRKVEVYFNLHTHKWSVRQDGRVLLHCDAISIENAQLVVGKAGRQRVLREQKKNVHAFVRGYVVDESCGGEMIAGIRYNPYQMDSFQRSDTGADISTCARVEIDSRLRGIVPVVRGLGFGNRTEGEA